MVQQSVDQIYNAYVSKNANTTINNAEMKKVMPDVDATAEFSAKYSFLSSNVQGSEGN